MQIKECIKRVIPDRFILKRLFRLNLGYCPNFKEPRTFNEKINWLKLYDRNPLYTTLVDKFAVKQWVSQKYGNQCIVPTLGLWKNFDEIDFDLLPNQFVLKCTHDSGGLVICKNKADFDVSKAREKLESSLKNNFYYRSQEWPYKDVPPRIIAEKYLEMSSGDVIDYKLHCFNGKVRFVLTCSNRFSNEGPDEIFYDLEWNRIPVSRPGQKNTIEEISKPRTLSKMIEFSESFAKDFRFVRVDFYEVDGKLFFGEFTFYPASGLKPFVPEKYDEIFGSYLIL